MKQSYYWLLQLMIFVESFLSCNVKDFHENLAIFNYKHEITFHIKKIIFWLNNVIKMISGNGVSIKSVKNNFYQALYPFVNLTFHFYTINN